MFQQKRPDKSDLNKSGVEGLVSDYWQFADLVFHFNFAFAKFPFHKSAQTNGLGATPHGALAKILRTSFTSSAW